MDHAGPAGIAVLALLLAVGATALSTLAAPLASLLARPAHGGRCVRPGRVDFVIVTKASNSVLDVLDETISRVREMFPQHRLWIVTDEGADGIRYLRGLEEYSAGLVRLIVVPSSYDKGRYKARAINYFIENYVEDNVWYVFLDDDSYPLDGRFLCELDPSRALVYQGIIAPRRGRSLLAWLADASRYYHDAFRNRLALGLLGKPVYGLHGELLVVRGSVLKDIGFETDSLAEDTWFAGQLIKRGVRVRQVSSRVSILSPNSIVDMWRQRARWNLGVLRDILKGRYPASLTLARGVDALVWLVSPFMPLVFYLAVRNPLMEVGLLARALGALLLLAGIVSNTIYPTTVMGLRGALLALAALPGVMAAMMLAPLYALPRLHVFLSNFVIIDKRVAGEAAWELPGDRASLSSRVFDEMITLASTKPEVKWFR